ncbi:mitochondrial carrier domain-containing protein [Mycena amicta]|nr:mitochondrial carrier domain-containing protein [Mycena amicta]
MTLRESVKEIAIGSFAGIVSEVLEYPTDLAKVRLQAQLLTPPVDKTKLFKGPVDCLTQTFRHEGFRGLYRGLPVPIAGSMIETGALFVSYAYFQNIIRTYSSSNQLTIPQLGLAAAGAGFVTSFILTPIELIKCKMQVQLMNSTTTARIPPIHKLPKPVMALVRETPGFDRHKSFINLFDRSIFASAARAPGLVEVVRSTVAAHGVKGLWLGHAGTVVRETGGTSAWFAVKEYVASTLLARRLGPSYHLEPGSVLLPWESAVSGAVSGAACVLAFYPADTVKSAMQTEEELLSHRRQRDAKPSPRLSFYQTFLKLYKAHGVRGLYAGGGMTALRAVPSSGIVFVVYDGLSAFVG